MVPGALTAATTSSSSKCFEMADCVLRTEIFNQNSKSKFFNLSHILDHYFKLGEHSQSTQSFDAIAIEDAQVERITVYIDRLEHGLE